jgi:cytochrome bd-type quinol oxidase subunit 2
LSGVKVLTRSLAVVAVVLWAVVGYLLLLELQSALTDSETEHSPWAVAIAVAPVALAVSVGWYASRRVSRR